MKNSKLGGKTPKGMTTKLCFFLPFSAAPSGHATVWRETEQLILSQAWEGGDVSKQCCVLENSEKPLLPTPDKGVPLNKHADLVPHLF